MLKIARRPAKQRNSLPSWFKVSGNFSALDQHPVPTMKNNTRSLLSISAMAIAAVATVTTNADAQCPGGCFGYPTPNRSFTQQVQIIPTFVPVQQYAPVIAPPIVIEQPLVGQPTIIQSQQVIGTPQTFYPTQPSNIYYPPQAGVISSGQVIDQAVPVEQFGSSKNVEEVEEGKIEGEGEVVTPDNDSKPGVVEKDESDKKMDGKGSSTKMDAKMSKADKMKADKMKADKMKADKKVDEPEVLTSAQRISKLETSMKRQMARAKQASKRDLDKTLKQMKADDDDSASKIAVAKMKAQKALDDKLEAIEKRVKARIDQIEN